MTVVHLADSLTLGIGTGYVLFLSVLICIHMYEIIMFMETFKTSSILDPEGSGMEIKNKKVPNQV